MDANVRRKLEAVLGRLCGQCDGLLLTQAVKLPYLVDVVAQRVLGKQIIGATYEAWNLGVVTKEAWIMLKHEPPPFLAVTVHAYSETGLMIQLSGSAPNLSSQQEVEVVDAVAQTYGRASASVLGDLTKRMNPQISKWGSNERAATDYEAYQHLSDGWGRLALFGLTDADLDNRSNWGPEIDDPAEYVRRALS